MLHPVWTVFGLLFLPYRLSRGFCTNAQKHTADGEGPRFPALPLCLLYRPVIQRPGDLPAHQTLYASARRVDK